MDGWFCCLPIILERKSSQSNDRHCYPTIQPHLTTPHLSLSLSQYCFSFSWTPTNENEDCLFNYLYAHLKSRWFSTVSIRYLNHIEYFRTISNYKLILLFVFGGVNKRRCEGFTKKKKKNKRRRCEVVPLNYSKYKSKQGIFHVSRDFIKNGPIHHPKAAILLHPFRASFYYVFYLYMKTNIYDIQTFRTPPKFVALR